MELIQKVYRQNWMFREGLRDFPKYCLYKSEIWRRALLRLSTDLFSILKLETARTRKLKTLKRDENKLMKTEFYKNSGIIS